MSRYMIGRVRATKPLFVETPMWGGNDPHLPSLTVDDSAAADTGLIMPTGEPIMRLPEQIGFHRPGK